MTMHSTDAISLVDAVWNAVETRQLDRLDELVSPDVELSTSTASGRGLAFFKGVFGRHVEAYPDIHAEILDSVESGDRQAVAVEVAFTATHGGELKTPLGALPATGRPLSWRSADHIRVQDGRIVSWRAHFDRMVFLEQLGLLDQLVAAPAAAS